MCKKIQPFVLKAGDSTNDHPNDNGPNYKLKSLYNVKNIKWLLKYGTKKFSPHHINSALVESWDTFKVSSGNIIRYRFAKTMLLPLSPPDLATNTQACTAYIQLSSGSKAEEINNISRHIVALIALQVTRTYDPMFVLQTLGTQQSSKKIILVPASYDAVIKLTVIHIQ